MEHTSRCQPETLCQLPHGSHPDPYGAVSYPIYQTATFAHAALGESTGFDYTRMQNPTREQLEQTVCVLEGGFDALAFSSGMAAISAVMELFSPGDHIITDEDLYGGSVRLFHAVNAKNGLTFTGLNLAEDDITPHITDKTKAIYLETPTNPMMRVIDLEKINRIAKEHHLLMIVDNTFLSPYLQNPLSFGADIVIHSGSKYLGGHNDTICGLVVCADQPMSERLRYICKTTGAGLSPFDSWLILRGIRTLAVRMDRAEENAAHLAHILKAHPKVTHVNYPGLHEHPGHEIMKKQARGFGAMLSFTVESTETAERILSRVQIIRFAESLGGTESLITYPMTQTHADVPPDLLEKIGITDKLLRLSVGIEAISDLERDLSEALG